MQPTLVGWLQVQPIDPVGLGADMQSEVGREQVSIFCGATPATVHPLRERLLLSVPAQTGLRQGGGSWVVLVELLAAGAFSLAAHHLHQ
jgi:hypothetical protein